MAAVCKRRGHGHGHAVTAKEIALYELNCSVAATATTLLLIRLGVEYVLCSDN